MRDIRSYLRDLPVFDGPLPGFDPTATPSEPSKCFIEWLYAAVAAGVREPHAMVLSTHGLDGIPSARVLLLKNVSVDGWQFAVHGSSPKGQELAAAGVAAMTFYWPDLARQVRVRGHVEREPAEASAADFLARSDASRSAALIGSQSTVLDDIRSVDAATTDAMEHIRDDPDFVEPQWILYTLLADSVEFWQGNVRRKHGRIRYERQSEAWTKQLLWP